MKRSLAVLSLVAVVALALPAFAGGDGECNYSAQECLNKYAAKLTQMGWAGFDGDYNEEKGIFTVTAIETDSPATTAGFRVGDELYAWNGHKFIDMSEEDWKASMKERTPGATADYAFYRDGKSKDLKVTLASMPEDKMASKIGAHMLTHAEATEM